MFIPQRPLLLPLNNMGSSSKVLHYFNSSVADKVGIEIVFYIKSAQLLIKHIALGGYEQVIHLLCKQV